MPYLGKPPPLTASVLEDSDQDTKVQVEESADEDIIRFDTGGSERMTVAAGGTVDVVGDLTVGTLTADGDTAAGDNASIGYTSAEGLILTGQGSTDDITIKNDADTTVVNVATGATDVEISAGNIVMGTASKGIYLGVTSATAANLLDDYEEGTYTGAITTHTSGGYTMQANQDTLSYTKIGNICTIIGQINAESDNSPNGTLRINLPFTIKASVEGGGKGFTSGINLSNHADGTTNTDIVGWLDPDDGTYLNINEITEGTGAIGSVQHDHVDTAFSVFLWFSYMTT